MTYKEFEERIEELSCPLCCAHLELEEEPECGACVTHQTYNAICSECDFAYKDVLHLNRRTTDDDIQKMFDEMVEGLTKRCNG